MRGRGISSELQGNLFGETNLGSENRTRVVSSDFWTATPEPDFDLSHADGVCHHDVDAERLLWQEDIQLAYSVWMNSRRVLKRKFNDHSVQQYKSMFNGFATWLTQVAGKSVLSANASDINRFLGTKTGRNGSLASATTRRRYLHLIYGAYGRIRELKLIEENPAEALVQNARQEDFQRPAPIILRESEMENYIKWTMSQSTSAWVEARDTALRLMFLATGITVHELQALGPDDLIQPDGPNKVLTLSVAAHGFVQARVVPVAPFAHAPLLAWASRLEALAPALNHLFPGRFYGFGIDRPDDTPVSSPECYTIVQTALNAVGYDNQRQGPQTLRNSFIAHQIWEGREPERITQWLGLNTNETVGKIARLVPIRADGVAPA